MIELKGKTNKGVNKLNAFGTMWNVHLTDKFKGEDAVLLESNDGRSTRWVLLNNDPDFEIVSTEIK